jgi:hypothetical protein
VFAFIASLPKAHGLIYPDLPRALELTPLPGRLASLTLRLSELGPPPYRGLTWRGGTAPAEQGRDMAWMLFKEIPLKSLAAALEHVDGTFLALQRNPGPGEIDELGGCLKRPVHDLCDLNEDLEAMLALLALLDDYIGVSNTNMHLRAGVGKTARVLVPCPAEWRWMAQGDRSPWFPGFSIYRQENNGDWSNALAQLTADLGASPGRPKLDARLALASRTARLRTLTCRRSRRIEWHALRNVIAFALDNDDEAHLHAVEIDELETLEKLGQPPRRGPLDQVRVAPIRQMFESGFGVNGKKSDACGNPLQIIQDIIQQHRFNVLEHVDARHQSAGLRRFGPGGYRRIVMMDMERLVQMRL